MHIEGWLLAEGNEEAHMQACFTVVCVNKVADSGTCPLLLVSSLAVISSSYSPVAQFIVLLCSLLPVRPMSLCAGAVV